MGRIVVRALVALCVAGCATSSAWAHGAKTVGEATNVKPGKTTRGTLYQSSYFSGASVAFWNVPLLKGDRVAIRTAASGADTPPCQLLFMPGTGDDVTTTSPLLEPKSATRDGSLDRQRFVATNTGTYVLAMTNADLYLSSPLQCLDAPAGSAFTFKVTVTHRGSVSRSAGRGPSERAHDAGPRGTRIIKPGQSLWVIAQGLVGEPADIGEIAFEVGRLWRLNAARIGSGDPDLIFPGLRLRLK
jgi:hypothetical protein